MSECSAPTLSRLLKRRTFLLKTDRPAVFRNQPAPEEWFKYHNWKSVGQKSTVSEWNLELMAALVSRTPDEYQQADGPSSR